MKITWPKNTKEIIDAIRGTIGRIIQINSVYEYIPCSGCNLDPVTQQSTNVYCPICSGKYWIPVVSGLLISGHVRWFGADQPLFTAGGVIDQGDCTVTIEYTDLNLLAVQKSIGFIVDNRDLYLKEYILRGIPTPNRIRIILKEDSE